MDVTRTRALALLVATLAVGVGSRAVRLDCRLWDKWLGDALYAVAVYLALALVAPRVRPAGRAAATLGICSALELFQLTGIPDGLADRQRWVGWVLGTEFGWADLACYTVGVAAIVLVTARRPARPRTAASRSAG